MPNGLIPHYVPKPALPYVPDASPLELTPHFKSGLNVLSSIRGYVEKRPGHAAFEDTPTTFTDTIKRIFGWKKWGGAFYIMVNEVSASQSIVYKYKIGTDSSFVSIFTSSSAVPFDFVVANDFVFFGNGTDMKKYDGTSVTGWGIAKPAAAPGISLSSTGLSATAGGYSYRYAFANSSTGHIGAISDASAYTGNFSNKTVTVTGSTTSDGQVDKVRIYRTADGGATWYEHPSSPIAYSGSWSLNDTAASSALNTSAQASLPGQNTPPTASSHCAFFAGRIWTAINDTVYYSNFEESINGITVESFASINQYKFGVEVTGLAVTQRALLIFTRSGIWKITGDSRSSFLLQPFRRRSGIDNQANVAVSPQDVCAWLDLSGTVWLTDTTTTTEIGRPIRTDVATFTQTSTSVAFHYDGVRRWLIVADSVLGKSWVFDMDLNQWMVPWDCGGTALASCETSAGAYTLLRTDNDGTQVGKMTPSTYTDFGSSYAESLIVNLFEVGDGRGPGEVGTPEYIAIDRGTVALSDVLVLTDDDPAQGTFTSIFANEIPAPDRTAGSHVIQKWYPLAGSTAQTTAERVSMKITRTAQTSNWQVYAFDLVTRKLEDIYASR